MANIKKLKYSESPEKTQTKNIRKTSTIKRGICAATLALGLPLVSVLNTCRPHDGNAQKEEIEEEIMGAVFEGDKRIINEISGIINKINERINGTTLPVIDIEGGNLLLAMIENKKKYPEELFDHIANYNEKADNSFMKYAMELKKREEPFPTVEGKKSPECSFVMLTMPSSSNSNIDIDSVMCNDFKSIDIICKIASPNAPDSCAVGARTLLMTDGDELAEIKKKYEKDLLGNGICQNRDAVVRMVRKYLIVDVPEGYNSENLVKNFAELKDENGEPLCSGIEITDSKIKIYGKNANARDKIKEELKKMALNVKEQTELVAAHYVTVYSEEGTEDCKRKAGGKAVELHLPTGAQ
ncbi:MAG: hypothetical protein QXT45_03590 [Candidatus Bilamarchaeaceae archaeon]